MLPPQCPPRRGNAKMAPMKTAMKGQSAKTMTKGAIAQALADACELKKTQCTKVLDSLADVGTKEVAKAGIFTIPGLCRIKTRVKPATKAGKKEIFGKMCMVKARPARTIVKAFAVAALKASV